MTPNDRQRLVRALEEIRKAAMDHPCFWRDAFEARDIEAICYEGGDTAAWTLLAITADDALKPDNGTK